MSLSLQRRLAVMLAVAALAALTLWWRSRGAGPYQASFSDPMERWLLSLALLAYMGGAAGYDVYLLSQGKDLAIANSASYILWLLGKRESEFIWANGFLTMIAWQYAFHIVSAVFLVFQTHLFFSITGLPVARPEPT